MIRFIVGMGFGSLVFTAVTEPSVDSISIAVFAFGVWLYTMKDIMNGK